MIEDWKQEIAVAWLVKQAMMELDEKRIFPYHLPNLAASAEQISTAEQIIGYSLDPKYKEFLKQANGWPAFWHSTDLFGTEDLLDGPRKETGDFQLSLLDESVLKGVGLRREELLPIGATKFDRDLFVLTNPPSNPPRRVIWFAGEVIERFSSFDDYFRAMVNLSRMDVERFRRSTPWV